MVLHFRRVVLVTLAFAILTLPGCYQYYVASDIPDESQTLEYERKTLNSYAWGLLQDDPIKATGMTTNYLYDVRVSTNFGYVLLSILTVGIWVPMDLEWRMASRDSTPSPDPLPDIPEDDEEIGR